MSSNLIVCFNMVAIPDAATPTDRDRIGMSSPQRMTPYKNIFDGQ